MSGTSGLGPDTRFPERKHLRRLERIFVSGAPIYYLTVCVHKRRPLLTRPAAADVLVEQWHRARELHQWVVGRYVVMPDHVHFFASPAGDEAKPLSGFMNYWKRSTALYLRRICSGFSWQKEFFDHLLRSADSYEQKWLYVRENPVRKGLATCADDWPYQGEIGELTW